jgi:aerobic-type carbon monoxide dehydrogenase small subunit (CoxS/CutS family)
MSTSSSESPSSSASSNHVVRVEVNGAARTLAVEGRTLLSDALRLHLGLTGTHVGCEQGSCGSCTVLVDGRPTRSCLVLAVQVDGAVLATVEGVATNGVHHRIQDALRATHGLQCGFCTPGIVMSLVAAADRGAPVDEVIDEVLGGHLCRCTGYVNIRAAVRRAWGDGALS